jgi:type VI secretion system protein ImpH
MATAQRRPRLALIRQLLAAPHRFEFFQAVRLLENAASATGEAEPSAERVRFSGNHALHFSGAVIAEIPALPPAVAGARAGPQWQMRVNVLSLAGSAGVLPYHYSELLLQRLRARDDTLRDFFDLFNHRTIALLFQAWQKYRLPIAYEQHHRQRRRGRDPITNALTALIGLGTPRLSEHLALDEEALLGFGGVFGRLIKSAAALENMLRQYLQLDVRIEQFRGQWHQLPDDLRTRLPGDGLGGMNHALGVNAMVGAHCWQVQSKFRVRIRDLTYAQLMELAPTGAKMQTLKTLTRFAAGTELDFDIALNMDCVELPPMQLAGAQSEQQPLLGWNTCLHPPGARRRGQVDIVVSQSLQ